LAALASEERAARERSHTVRIETPENIQMNEREENKGLVVGGELEGRLDENNDTAQLQVLAEIEVQSEVEVPIPLVTDIEVTPVKNENRASLPQSASQQSVNGKSGGYTYSHRAALKARMTSLNSTDSGSSCGGLSGASAVDKGLTPGSSPAPTPSSPSSQDFSYAAFQSAALQVFLYLLATVTLLALLVLTHALVFSLSPA
jgi:hypothetical protein